MRVNFSQLRESRKLNSRVQYSSLSRLTPPFVAPHSESLHSACPTVVRFVGLPVGRVVRVGRPKVFSDCKKWTATPYRTAVAAVANQGECFYMIYK